ncbi:MULTISPECIES: serine hydrolase domain-containing protein [unclassified Streptomyces]|uniref:serine hydrolase domain-containing protein n=1 Tax=unclassified Streptomyces TaxID=2593676 RepID=UPI002E35EFA1|nr:MULTISPECIES: serine hydrolase domain-containing protein [unclassified Streptomyces]WUC62835.1 beta-lactamase family protein [Streptomyces sp. NBC_00539]
MDKAQDLDTLALATAERLARGHVGVAVAVVADGQVAHAAAGTTGRVDGGTPGADTLFEIGSVTKTFTTLCLARMAVAGTVELDEPLARLLPEGTAVPSRDGQEITLRHLATHTSGLPRLPKGMMLRALLRPRTPDPYAGCTADVLLSGLARTRLGTAPGGRGRYSNLGAGLLGLALARRAGSTYGQLVTTQVCAPLGMSATGVAADATRPGRLAQGHDSRRRPTPPWNLADLAGAGGLRSSATELVSYVRAQLDCGGPTELAEAVRLTRQVEHRDNRFSWMHLGWRAHRLHPRQGAHVQIWHNGGTGGFASFVGFDPETGTAAIVLSNTQRPVDAPGFDLLRTLQDRAASRGARPGGR